MREYYYTDGTNRYGPMSIEELKSKGIKSDTYIWYEGLENWIIASEVPELKELFADNWDNTTTSSYWNQVGSKDIDSISNNEIKDQALSVLNGNWGNAIGAFAVYLLVLTGAQFVPFVGGIASLIIGGPMYLGISIFSLKYSRKQETRLENIFDGFQNFGNSLAAYLLIVLFTFLWMLLLIVPGIIASISYSQTFYIMAEEEAISPMDAIDKSKAMMYGYKWKYFLLNLGFIGWILLSILTLGIGLLWLMPYMQISRARFYDLVKQNYKQNQI